MPEVQDFPQTKEALKMNLTLRCLIRTKYRDGKSRRSAAVISWAQTSLKNLTGAAIRKVGKETAGFSIELIMIQVLDSRSVIHICYDVFLDECDPRLRNEISVKFHAKHPIHLITGKGKSFLMRRDERMDTKVFEQYLQMSSKDRGPWPLFVDCRHPPVYGVSRAYDGFRETVVAVKKDVKQDY